MYLATFIVLFVLALIVVFWVMGAYNFIQPTPQRPDANFQVLINAYNTKEKSLWFANDKCVFDRELGDSCYRYVVLESDGTVVYDSKSPSRSKSRKGCREVRARDIPRTVEYQRASVTLEGTVLRDSVANLCVAAKEGSVYRMVHISSPVPPRGYSFL